MSPEQIARRYEKLPGFSLVDYSPIALPLWQLSVETISLAHRRFQPIIEYVMRTISLGLSIEDAAGFLGLEVDVVQGALSQLLADRLVTPKDDALSLTELGRQALAEEGLQLPAEEQIPILFDGLTRGPALTEPEHTVLLRDIEDGAFVEIAAAPPTRPTISELRLADIVQFLSRQSGGRREMGRDILRLKSISRWRRVFREGVGLVFKARIGRELRVLFIVDGTIDQELQNRFAIGGGPSRPWFVRAFSDAYVSANVRRHLGQEASRIQIDFSEYENLQQHLSMAKLRRAALLRKAQLVRSGALPVADMPSKEAMRIAATNERDAANALVGVAVRPAAVYEANELLKLALKSANSSLTVSSRGLAPHIVDSRFIEALRSAISRRVKVEIVLHESSLDWPKRGPGWAKAYTKVNELCQEAPEFIRVSQTREERFFHLSWDRQIALVCNRPLLSNHGRVKAFEQFAGFVLQRNDLVDAYLQRVLGGRA